tara:strand:+ start:239 stop:946 length:708 start_codon:yes stop_codon:yes gene_type:complete
MALPQLNNARYEVTIPSTGQTVTYRPYLVKEEKILMMAMESNDSKMIMKATSDVIKACVYEDIDIDKLAMFDVETLFLTLRSKSVGESIDLNIKCDKCDSRNDVQISFDDIKQPVVNDEKRVIMVTEDVGITLRYPSFKDVSLIKPGDDASIEGAMNLVVQCIDNIFDDNGVYDAKNETKKGLTDFVESLNNEQFIRLSDFFQSSPSLSYDIEFDCASCKEPNVQELRGLQSFFT